MVLPSNSCPDTQPNNEASNYIVDYENSINFHGTWQVAMTEVMIFYTPSTIRKGSFIKYQEIKKATTLDGGCIISRDDIVRDNCECCKFVVFMLFRFVTLLLRWD